MKQWALYMNWHTDKDTNLPKIESSNGFEYSLREDRIPFNKMLNECRKEEYSKAFDAKAIQLC
jgi:hypothetical protein